MGQKGRHNEERSGVTKGGEGDSCPPGAAGEGREKAWPEHFATNKHKTFLNEPKMVYNDNFLTFMAASLFRHYLRYCLAFYFVSRAPAIWGCTNAGGKRAHGSPHATSPIALAPMGGRTSLLLPPPAPRTLVTSPQLVKLFRVSIVVS